MKNAFLLFAVAFLILVIFLPVFTKVQDIKQKDFEYRLQIEALKEENQKLVEEKRLLEEDPDYLEKVAREKMGLIRQGEVVYHITPAEEGSEK